MTEYRWNFSISWLAHFTKGCVKQHHTELIPAFARFLSPASQVIDVGAHSGQYTKLFSRMVPEGHVFSFEPSSYALSILRPAIALNRLKNVTILPFALSSQSSISVFQIPVKRRGTFAFGLSHLQSPHGPVDERDVQEQLVPITTLDMIAAAIKLENLDLVKIDVEGWEQQALMGSVKTIADQRPVIFIEMIDNTLRRVGDSLEGIWALLESWDYKPYGYQPENGFREVSDISDGDFFWIPDERNTHTLLFP